MLFLPPYLLERLQLGLYQVEPLGLVPQLALRCTQLIGDLDQIGLERLVHKIKT